METILIQRIVEAAILASNQPITLSQLYGLFPEEQQAPAGSIEQAIDTLRAASAERGVELVEVASGFRYQVQADVHAWVARMWTERPTRYTRATLETLSLIAYRQPITRGEIEQIRGVAVNSNIVKMLEEREWIRVIGHRDVPGKPALFGTTKGFLDYFNLKSLDQLPPLAELNDIPDLDPQLDFEPRPAAGFAEATDGVIPDVIPAMASLDGDDADDDASDPLDEDIPSDAFGQSARADEADPEPDAGDNPRADTTTPLPSPGDDAGASLDEGAEDDSAPERIA